jgi:mannose-6-phosphate isomerase-like protein (cupin superfamily)
LIACASSGTLAAVAESLVQPFAVAPGEGLAVANPTGAVTTFKAMADVCGGSITAIEGSAAPGEGPPLHVHVRQDELIYTLEGMHRVKLGDQIFHAPVGTFIFIPRGTPHTWQNTGDTVARFFAAFAPAAPEFEQFFVRFADLTPSERGVAAFARLAEETHAMEVVGPPLGHIRPF